MKFVIQHEISGRMRVHLDQKRMSFEQADILHYYLQQQEGVLSAKVYERTADASITYQGDRDSLIRALRCFSYEKTNVPAEVLQASGRELNACYQEKLIMKVLGRMGRKLFVPLSIRTVLTTVKSLRYMGAGLNSLRKGQLDVAVLDGAAIGVSVLRGNMETAGSIMFLLGIGELLEEWTHKKSVGDLARSMSLNIQKVWLMTEDKEVLVSSETVVPGDKIVVHMGNLIPFDGLVVSGEAMVNQASFTGESLPVKKSDGGFVYAGTVVEEGELVISVSAVTGSTRYEKIVTMIEESEKLKSASESRAEQLADRLGPLSLLGTGGVLLWTRIVTKALAVLMVDFSCALKLAIPVSVLSAIREAGSAQITVKGGKFLEAVADAQTIVFDKTGTLTEARPMVKTVVPFCEESEDTLLRIAACMEEHFPHSMAKAVVNAAWERGLIHDEMHSKVEYIVAHGIASTINGRKVIIGSHHFVFEDENCRIPEERLPLFESLPPEYSHLYLAIDGEMAEVICIEDPIRPEAREVIAALKEAGIAKVVMMTGDSERTAAAVAKLVGVDEYYSEVLPEDKASFVEAERAAGRKVIMIGDGVNDSPALSAADVGIAISDGAELAREIADITIGADSLYQLPMLKILSNRLMHRLHRNYRSIVSFNSGLIVLGVAGLLQPATSALLHNISTLVITLRSMDNLLD